MQITITYTTVTDRGSHESEKVTFEMPDGSEPVSLRVVPARVGSSHKSEVRLYAGLNSTILHKLPAQSGPVMIVEVSKIVDAFKAAGWEAEANTETSRPDFGVTQTETVTTLTAGPDAQPADDVIAAFVEEAS